MKYHKKKVTHEDPNSKFVLLLDDHSKENSQENVVILNTCLRTCDTQGTM